MAWCVLWHLKVTQFSKKKSGHYPILHITVQIQNLKFVEPININQKW